jgi:hypothetical protein
MRVVEPRGDWHGVVRVEDVRRGRVVQDNRVGNRTAQLRQILDIIPLVIITALAEQSMRDDMMDI